MNLSLKLNKNGFKFKGVKDIKHIHIYYIL